MSKVNNVSKFLNKSTIQVIRSICHELKLANKQIKNSNNDCTNFFLKQCRLYQTTDERLCNSKNEARFIGETYLIYLNSLRKYKEINQAYAGKGERNVAETANLVGLKLPFDS